MWLQLPRTPALDGERWFKAMLCTLVRGEVERAGGDAAAFEAAVTRGVPYHPAAKLPERKISNPAASVPGLAVPGELALVEQLAKLTEPADRVSFLFEQDRVGLDARLSDPFELGPAYDPALVLGPPASWDALASWPVAPAFGEAIGRSVRVTWVLLEGRPERASGWLAAMADALPAAVVVPWSEQGPEALAVVLRGHAPTPTDRLIVVAEEAAVTALLETLPAFATLRDQILAVLAIGGVIGGRTDEEGRYGEASRRDWLEAHFDQASLDTEVVRLTPYLAVQRLERGCWPPGVPGLPLQAQRFPAPGERDAVVQTIEAVDLGPLWAEGGVAPALVGRALVAVVAGWVASRRSG